MMDQKTAEFYFLHRQRGAQALCDVHSWRDCSEVSLDDPSKTRTACAREVRATAAFGLSRERIKVRGEVHLLPLLFLRLIVIIVIIISSVPVASDAGAKDRCPIGLGRQRHTDNHIEATRPRHGGVEQMRQVRRADETHVTVGCHAVHFNQQRRQQPYQAGDERPRHGAGETPPDARQVRLREEAEGPARPGGRSEGLEQGTSQEAGEVHDEVPARGDARRGRREG